MFAYGPWKFSKVRQFEILSVVVTRNQYKRSVDRVGREREREEGERKGGRKGGRREKPLF